MTSSIDNNDNNDNIDNSNNPQGKKKARYSRQQKREHKARSEQLVSEERNYPPRKQQLRSSLGPLTLTWQDRIFQCIRDADSTRSIYVKGQGPPPPLPFSDATPSSFALDHIQLITCSTMDSSHPLVLPTPGLTIRVQPLLILDLNGILCHRSRPKKEPPGVQLRPAVGATAGTPVVLRTDLEAFLRMLDHYFCLAIWTSAKSKTARALLNFLVPEDIQKRLLFVWAQHHCEAVQLPTETLFEKHLPKVWKAFPLWNANNTLLIDDSPDKCPFAPSNAIHPPPLHGQCAPPLHPFNQPWIPDEYNQSQQYQFFQQYIQFWHQHPFVEDLTELTVPTEVQGVCAELSTPRVRTNQDLYEFLKLYGSGHMGWRGGTIP